MEQNEFIIELLAGLNKQKCKKQIDTDIKQLENVIKKIKLICTFTKGNTKKELNAYITQLNKQLNHIKLQAKLDNKKLQREINESLKNIRFSDIDLNIDEGKIKMKVKKAVAEAKAEIDKNPLAFNIEIRKEKLNNQLTSYLNKNSKIKESSLLLEEADKLRKIFSGIGDKSTAKYATEQFQLFKSEVVATGFAGQSTTDKIKNMVGHITKIGTAFGVASTAINQFSQSQRNLKEIDTILTEISKTSEMTKNQLIELGDTSFDTANKYGQLAKNYLLGVQEMARSGYEEKATELGELSLLAQSAGDMTSEMANSYILATDAAYKYSGNIEKLTSVLDGANYVSNKNSASLTDIADGIRVSASYAANAGVEIDQLTAAEATMIATTKRSGSEMGRAFRSILLNLQQVSGEFDGEVIDEESLKKVEDRCHSLGVELEYMKDGVATLRNPMEVLKELSQVYNSLPDNSADKQGLISDLGGKYHANALTALLSRWDLYEKMIQEYSQGTGSALVEANKTADSWEGKLSQLQNTWDSFVNNITNKEVVKGGISFLDGTIQSFEKLTDIIGTIPTMLTAINGSVSALNKDYGITQLLNQDTHKMDIQGSFMGIDFTKIKAQKKHFDEAAAAIEKWNAELASGQTDLNDFGEAIVKNSVQFKSYLATCTKEAPASLAGYKSYLNAAGVSTDALRLKTVLLTSAMSLGIGLAIQAVVGGIIKLVQAQEELRQATQEAAQTYKSSAESISDYTKRYEELHTALLKAKGNEEETYNIKKQLLELQTELNDKFGEEYGKLNLVTDAYKDQTDAIREYNKEAANKYLNENEKGIRQAKRDMEKVDTYNLSYTGLSEYTDEGKILKELAEQYESLGVKIDKDNESGLFAIHLKANAEDAYEVINAFTTDLRKMSADLDETLFTSTFDLLSDEIGRANKIIDRSGEPYHSGLEAEIKANDNLSAKYEKATLAVEAYNEAVLKSENPYNDENVKKAYDDLQLIKSSIQENEEEWGKYSSIMDEVFSSASTKQYEFYESLKPQISSLKSEFEGLSNLELRSMASASDNDAFNKLAASAKEYGIEVDGLIDLLVQLGIAQSDVSDFQFEDAPRWDLTETIEQLSEMKSALSTLDQAFAKLYDKDQQIGFDDFAAISEAFKGMDGLDDFISRLQDAGQDTEKVTSVMEDLIGTYLEFSGILDNVTEENQGLIISMLEEMGIANASEIVNLALANSHIEVAVQKIMNANASFDLATATAEEINKMIEEAGESDIVRQKLALLALQKQLCNQTTIMTDGDIQNLQALARQAGATSAAIAAIKNTNAKLSKYEHYYKRNPEKAEKLWQETYDGIYNSIPNKTQLDFKQARNSSGSAYAPRYSGGPSTQKAIKSAANDAAKAAKKAKEEFKELFDFFERRVKVLDDAFDLLKANLDNVVGAFAKNNLIDAQVGILDEKMKNYTDATAMYTQKANESLSKLDAGLQEKVKNGAVDLSTFVGDGNEEVVEAIKDYQNWADKIADCKQELAELKQKIRELELEKFNNIIEDFTNQFDLYGDSVDLIGKQIDLFKEAGMMIGESFYSVQKQQSEKQLATLEAEKAKLTEQLTSALSSGRIQQGTDEWLEMVNALTDVEGGILDCKKAIEEFDNAILDLHWEVFQRIQDTFSNLKSEMQNIIGVIDDMDVADEKGNWTKEGLTQLGLYAQQMELARYQVEQYNREINQLNADYLAGRYSVTEYTDKLAELSSAQWDAVNSVESAKDAIKDLNEARIEIAIDGINKEIDAYEKLIKARIDALKAAKDLHDYEQLIAEKTANITKLEKQIAAMQNDNTAATIAKRKLLEEQLAQARKELEDAEYEHSMQAQEDALNKELEDYRAAREAEIEALRASLEEKEILIAQSLETVKANTSVIAQEITMIAQMHGIQVSEAIINPWYSGQNAIASYGETLSAGTSAFIGQIIGVENQVYQLQADANNTANSLAYMFATRADNLVDQLTSSYMSEANLNAMTQALRDSLIQTLEGGYNIGNITSALGSIADAANGVASAANNAAQALANMGAAQADMSGYNVVNTKYGTVSRANVSESDANAYINSLPASVRDYFKVKKYASGTRNSKGMVAITDEEGYELKLDNLGAGKYTIMNEGSQVLTKPETDNIFGWAKLDPDMFNLQMPLVDMPKYTPEMVRTNNQNVNLNYGSLITVNGDVNDTKHFLGQMETVAEKAITKTFRDFTHTLKYRG